MSTFLSEVKGFTPLIHVLCQKMGLNAAAVYGEVWRYTNLPFGDGTCRASQETIAANLKLSRQTVNGHLQSLCSAGYLEDTTPDVKNVPHVYRDTGKAQILGLVEAKVGGVKPLDTSNEDAVKPLDSRCQATGQHGVKPLDSNRGSLEVSRVPSGQVEPGDGQTPVPTSCQGWLERLKIEGNSTAILMEAIQTLYPERELPTFARLGTTAGRVGGPRPMLQYLWQFSTEYLEQKIRKDLCDYIEAVHKGKTKNKQQKPKAQDQRRPADGKTQRAGQRPELPREGIDPEYYAQLRGAKSAQGTGSGE